MISLSRLRVFADGLDHPECVAVHPDGSIWAGGEAGQIYRIPTAGGRAEEVGRIDGGFILGLAFAPNLEWLLLCDLNHRALYRYELGSGQILLWARRAGRYQLQIPNFAVFASNGGVWVSDSGSASHPSGKILHFSADGNGTVWHPGPWWFANGLALDREEKNLYVVESFASRVRCISIMPDAIPGKIRNVCHLPHTVPDGLALAADGSLYIGCYQPSRIYCAPPCGRPRLLIEDWTAHALAHCTNLAFGSRRFNHLYIANFGRWHISELALASPGQPLACHIRAAIKDMHTRRP